MAKRLQPPIDVALDNIILRTFIMFVQTAHTVLKYADAHFYRKTSLSAMKFIVLNALAVNGGSMRPSEIAEWTYREKHNITTLVDRLKRDGLVETSRNSKDRRVMTITLTDKGQHVLNEATPVSWEIVGEVMSSFSEDDAVLLEKQLRVLRQNAHNGLQDIVRRSQPKPE